MMKSKSTKIIALALAVLMAASAMTGCAKSKRASEDSGNGNFADTITFAQGADPRGLDPAFVDDGESAKIMCNIYEGLLKYNKDSTAIEPCLAEKWDISPDQTKYTFHLKKGVKFQDGTDFNADAVKQSIDRQLEPKVTEDMPYASFVFGSIKAKNGVKEVKVIDDNTVEIDLFSPETAFLKNLAMALAAPIASPTALKKYGGNLNEHPVGTGPYSFVSWAKGQNVVLKANPNYWGAKAKTENVVFRFIKDNSARVIALTSGEVDAIDGIDSTVVDQITKGGDKLFTADGMNINYMAYNTTSSIFKSADARKAFSEAVNVPEMVKSLYKGYAKPATSILPSFIGGYSDSIKQTAYDAAAAKADLAKAGITKVNLITYSNVRPYNAVGGQTLAETIQGYLQKVGVTCAIKSFDWTTHATTLCAYNPKVSGFYYHQTGVTPFAGVTKAK